ncbi:MAG: TetR/AcrR family transcriptional regulator [Candidatus Binataceae bacterium]
MTPRTAPPQLSERVERLLDEAEALFVKEGFLHLSTDDLARLLHCSKRTLYTIARGRENFFATVMSRRMSRLERENIAKVQAARNVEDAILVCVEFMVEALESISAVYLRDLMRFPPGERAVRHNISQVTNALTKVIEQGERENVFRKIAPRVVAEALLASVRRMIDPDFLATSRVTSADAVRQVYQIFWFGLQTNQKAAAGLRLPRCAPKLSNGVASLKV